MPLLKRTAFQLAPSPADLKPEEPVFVVRFTKEVFRDYREYLNRINLYRQKVWTCKVTGKQNLTYEQALLSESKATEKVQQFPKEYMAPVLQMVQFSVLGINELVEKIYKAFKDRYVVGEIVAGIHRNSLLQCKITKLFQMNDQSESGCKLEYEVCWLNGSGKKMELSRESAENLSRKRYPLTKGLLKSFIRESAFAGLTRNSPWLVHDKLARKFKLQMEPPEELRQNFLGQNCEKLGFEENGRTPLHVDETPGLCPVAVKKSRTKHIVLENGGFISRKRKDLSETIHNELSNGEKNSKQRKKDREPLEVKELLKESSNDHKVSRKNILMVKPGGDLKKELKDKGGEKKKSESAKSNAKKAENIGNGLKSKSDDGSKSKSVDDLKSKLVKPKKEVPVPEAPPPIKYPIDDLLVQPSSDDPPFTERPKPSTDFEIPMECVGKLLMVWDFCISFGKAIHLSPFMLEDFEKALCYKDGDVLLLTEVHYALLRAIFSDPMMFQEFMQTRKRKSEMSLKTWKDDLCDLLEMEGSDRLKSSASLMRKGPYKQVDLSAKLEILHELVDLALTSAVIRNELGEIIDEHQAIAARKREEITGQSKKRKDEDDPQHVDVHVGTDGQSVSQQGDELEGRSPSSGRPDDLEEQETHFLTKHDEVDGRPHKQKALASIEETEKDKMSSEQRRVQEKKKDQGDHVVAQEAELQTIVDKQKRAEHFEREMEKHSIRRNPLGKDRDFNQYWFFSREGRVFVERKDSSEWGYYGAKEELDALLGSLNIKGVRERALKKHLEKHYSRISNSLQKRLKDISLRMCMEEASLRRSLRVRSAPKPAPFLTYVNKYRNY